MKMQNISYEQFFETQKTKFDEWQKHMKDVFGSFSKEDMTNFNMAEYYEKLFRVSQEFWKKGFDEWKKQMESAGQFPGMLGDFDFTFNPSEYYRNMAATAQDFWKKAGESKETYSALVELWRQLAEDLPGMDSKSIMEVYEKWSKEYASQLRSSLTPHIPDYMKDFSEKWMDNLELTGEKALENLKAWMSNGEDLQQAVQKMMAGSPNAYIEFMEVLKKNYEDTFGRIAHQPTFGKDMEFWRRYRDSFDRYVKFNIAATGFYTAMYEVIRDSTRKVIEDYMAMASEGDQPQTFDEFYKYWSKQVSANYDKVLFYEEYGRLAGNMVDEMARFKIAFDELCESYLAHLPVARKSDMEALHKTVYDLKKELRSLKKEIKGKETKGKEIKGHE